MEKSHLISHVCQHLYLCNHHTACISPQKAKAPKHTAQILYVCSDRPQRPLISYLKYKLCNPRGGWIGISVTSLIFILFFSNLEYTSPSIVISDNERRLLLSVLNIPSEYRSWIYLSQPDFFLSIFGFIAPVHLIDSPRDEFLLFFHIFDHVVTYMLFFLFFSVMSSENDGARKKKKIKKRHPTKINRNLRDKPSFHVGWSSSQVVIPNHPQ